MSTRLPLAGCRVLVTRARAQAAELTEQLEQLGARVVVLPSIEIVPAETTPIDATIEHLDEYDWIAFTSVNAVSVFADRLDALGVTASATSNVQIAAVGTATADRLRERGLRVDFVPEQFVAESLVEGLIVQGVGGQRVLLPQAELARETLASGLRTAGATVDTLVVYRTVKPDGLDGDAIQHLIEDVDVATFASPSAVRNAVALAAGGLSKLPVVCIGPITADAVREAGLTVAAVADEHSISGLVEAVVRLVNDDEKGVSDDDRQP